MAQTNFTPISLYYSATATNVPSASNLVAGELAINTADGKLFYKDSSNVVQVIGTKGGVGSSSTTQVLYNNAGTIAGSSNFVFDGTNVGIGAALSTWNTFTGSLQIAGTSLSGLGANNAALASNAYYNSAWKYYGTGSATLYQQNAGLHTWQYASSGTAGNNITFAEAMRIDGSGNVGIGTSSPAQRLDVVTTGGNAYIRVARNSQSAGQVGLHINGGTSGTDWYIANFASTNDLSFFGNGAERMRITSNGSLCVGTTTDGGLSSAIVSTGYLYDTNNLSANTVMQIWNQDTSGNNRFAEFYTEGGGGTLRGSITYNRAGGLVAYNVTSDYRSKDIIGSVLNSGEVIDSVPVYMGKMKGATQERPMFIAHETPDYAHTGEKDAIDKNGKPIYQQMDTSSLVPILWAEVQSLRKRLAVLESK